MPQFPNPSKNLWQEAWQDMPLPGKAGVAILLPSLLFLIIGLIRLSNILIGIGSLGFVIGIILIMVISTLLYKQENTIATLKYGEVYILPAACVLDSGRTRDTTTEELDRHSFPASEKTVIRYRLNFPDLPEKVEKYYQGTNKEEIIEVFLPDANGEFNIHGWMDGNKVKKLEGFPDGKPQA